MKKYQVLYEVLYEEPDTFGWQGFICFADDADHAEEQCLNAYPGSTVLWVSENESDEFNWQAMED